VSVSPRVPRAHQAVVAKEKLTGYALDPAHPRGAPEGAAVHSVLGIERTVEDDRPPRLISTWVDIR
jgi:hypothetical protein